MSFSFSISKEEQLLTSTRLFPQSRLPEVNRYHGYFQIVSHEALGFRCQARLLQCVLLPELNKFRKPALVV
jgi:hypothetical protein